MNGKIQTKTERSWTNPENQVKKFFEVEIEGIAKKYSCWQYDKLAAMKIGDEIEFTEVEKNGRWSLTLAGGKPGFQPRGKSPEEIKLQAKSFSASYSKDITVACLEAGLIKDSKQVDASILHYFNLFSGMMGG